MKPTDEHSTAKHDEFNTLPLSDAVFDVLFQAPEKDPATLENPSAQE